MIHKEQYTVQSFLCDCSDHLSLWGMARLFQETAEHHCDATGIGFADLLKQQLSWVIVQIQYQIEQMPSVGDNVMLSTWSRSTDGLYAYRDWAMHTMDGRQLIGATSSWVALNMQTRHVSRLHDTMQHYEHHDIPATANLHPQKLVMPALDTTKHCVARRQVSHSMLDHVMHMNNAEYVRLISDSLNTEADGPMPTPAALVRNLNMRYVHETALHDTVSILSLNEGSTISFQLENSSGIAVQAKVLLKHQY